MPRVKPVNSLFNLCLENVTNHMDYWCNNRDAISIFNCLPSYYSSCILALLKQKKRLKREYLEFLLTHRLTFLDLSEEEDNDGPNENVPDYLPLASVRCPELTTLKLNGFKRNKKDYKNNSLAEVYILPWLPNFQNLQVLDISFTNADDNCFAILGVYCKSLKELNACGCLVSDYGIRKLCASVDGDQKLGQCKSIRKLKINGKNVSERGIEVALDNLPYLEEIDYPYLAQLLTRRLELEYFDTVLPQYSLTQLVYRYDHYFPCPSSAFSLAICMCPSIDEVHIELNPQDELTDADLLSLLALKTLRKLWILTKWDQSSIITFTGGVVPLLEKFGSSLDTLAIQFVPHTSIPVIMELCPNLRHLDLYYRGDEPTPGRVWPRIESEPLSEPELKFEKLEELVLMVDNDFDAIPTGDLILLFSSSPALVDVDVDSCDNLTSSVLEKILKKNPLRNLKTLKLYDCPIKKKGIELLMRESNPLQSIRWLNYNYDIAEFCNMWNAAAQMRKWDFFIENYDCHNDSDSDSDEESDEEADVPN